MKTVLITGGSSGIGLEMSTYFAKDGYAILWVSLLDEELQAAKVALQQAVPGVVIEMMALDLSQAGAAQKTYDWVVANQWQLDVLINNAAFGTFGFANGMPLDKEVAMIQLNAVTVFELTRLFLKDMLARDAGYIINISSNSSFQPVPKMAAYSATKAFVKHYSQGVAEELKALNSKVKVMTVCPGPIKDTPFKEVANMQKLKTFSGMTATTKEEVAKDVWRAFQAGKTFIATGARLRLSMLLQAVLPDAAVQFILRRELSE